MIGYKNNMIELAENEVIVYGLKLELEGYDRLSILGDTLEVVMKSLDKQLESILCDEGLEMSDLGTITLVPCAVEKPSRRVT